MALEVLVSKAINLPNLEKIGKSDPYVILLFQGVKKKTDYISGNLNPEWNERFSWEIGKKEPAPDDSLSIWVKDYEHVGRNRLMGEATLLLRNALESEQPIEYELNLFDHNQRPTAATLFLTVSYRKPQKAPESNLPSASTVQDPQLSGAVSQSVDLVRNDIIESTLSTQKAKFQVRVYVLEARNLLGLNINPICQVTLSHLAKQTQVAKSTSNPFWDEIFFFTLECTAMDLYKEVLELRVLNSRALRSNMLIGHFKIDLGQIFGQPQHAYVNKWLLLRNDDVEEAVAEVTGYLKASMAVIGPGNTIPDFTASDSTKDDIESNLLLPTGAQLKPAAFIIDLYQAADLPRMDPGTMEGVKRIFNIDDKKELIDPYMEIAYAGNKVASKIIYGNDQPSWNEKLFLGFQFPSVCETIQLTMKDWDRISDDDFIAVTHVPMPLISASGHNGFLPCFGPSWVNFYGAPREYQLLHRDKNVVMNENGLEGCCFRGRALLSLKTELGEYPSRKSVALSSDDVIRAQFHCRRRRFRLHATFLDAMMVNIIDTPVEFEVSIGNFGNKFEDHFLPSPSSTQPTNAVFDGCSYYYLPWKDTKPSVVVISQWEDVLFRLETLNILKDIVTNMEEVLKDFPSPDGEDYDEGVGTLVNKFLSLTDIIFPEPIRGQQQENELDRLMRSRRTTELSNLRDQARELCHSDITIKDAIYEMRQILEEIKKLTFEPQNSIPDIIIWMVCGKKRIGYKRIPAHDVLFSQASSKRGKNCDKTLTLLLEKPKPEVTESLELPAVLRVKLWFGLEADEKHWRESQTDSVLTVFAETYENQVNLLGNWTSRSPTMMRPAWSDASGAIELKQDTFVPPIGWRFEGHWFIDPEPSLKYNDDAGRQAYLEDVFENQYRLPGTAWNSTSTSWSDLRGDSMPSREEIEPPPGWEWDDIWQVDLHRAVDEEGWEYTVEATLGGYQPVEKTYHLCRRRRWVRLRRLTVESSLAQPEEAEVSLDEDGGWEYSTLFSLRFHNKRRRMDLVRRRRWHRRLVSDDPIAPLVFKITTDTKKTDSTDAKTALLSCPRICLVYKDSFQVQLRVYIHQARDLIAGDKTGFSDAYACVSFMNQSQKTQVIARSLSPTWDQTLIFDKITLYSTKEDIFENPPTAILEIYDRDNHGDDDFLGRVLLRPVVQDSCQTFTSPPLTWNCLSIGKENHGQILASCELFFIDEPAPYEPPKRGNCFIVPSQIRPILQLSAIEILCWGVRNMKSLELAPVVCPSIEFECGGHVAKSKPIRDAKINPNFDDPVLYMEMLLPREPNFMPPMNIKVRDNRPFGRKPIVGTCAIIRLDSYIHHPVSSEPMINGRGNQLTNDTQNVSDTIIDFGNELGKEAQEPADTSVDWWAKYYASIGELEKAGKYLQLQYHPMKVFLKELEKIEPYNGFSDLLNTFHLRRGLTRDLEESSSVGEFKGTFRIYPIPSDPRAIRPQRLLKALPHATKEEVLIRIYVVKAFDLVPKDTNGKADPYIRIKLGKKEIDNRKSYKPNTLIPIFGEVFEIMGVLPMDKDLNVAVWDYDLVTSDDLVGQTVIDLENRYLTKYRATCGLPLSYEISGLNRWRDYKKPTEILEDVCILRHLPSPCYNSSTSVAIGKKIYALEEFEKELSENPRLGASKERLALHILHTLNVVPEHVETRSLYNPAAPDLEQGKIQMWIEIFPKSHGKPSPAIDISPRIPLSYELRVILWNTFEVPLDETNAVSGDTMSDIFVKCCFADHLQKTDIHYRSMDGEGNFNWRMIFPFEYLATENKIVVNKKKHFWSLDKSEQLLLPKLSLQIWDDDVISSDDFLGNLEFSLLAIPKPTKSVQKCGLHQLGMEEGSALKYNILPSLDNCLNLFEKKRVRGFWPCCAYKPDVGYALAGKVEMELEILSSEEAMRKPAGRGRDEPNLNPPLEEPNRPSTSFLWFTSPWKSFKFILWRNYKWYCITLIVIILAVLLVFLFIYSFPEAVANRLVN